MVQSAFVARCPYEIGDTIKKRRRVSLAEAERFKLDPAALVEEVNTITDIVCVHSLKKGTVEFLYELDGHGPLVRLTDPKRRG